MQTYKWALFGLGLTAGLALVAALALLFRPAHTYGGSLIDPPAAAPEINLVDQAGRPFRLDGQRGAVTLLFFGYTHCPDACPATLSLYRRIKAALGRQAEHVRFVLVTVDPERDSPERLSQYLAAFDPDFLGLTGDPAGLETIWQTYGVFRQKVSLSGTPLAGHGGDDAEEEYLIDHTTRIYAIDPQGRLRVTYMIDTTSAVLARDVRELLR